MSFPKVSIVVATYNGELFLEKQLQSVISQTYSNLEIIVCDDCSTDTTLDIVKKFQQLDNRVQVITNNNNKGYVKNFETGLNCCSGELIALCDQDDIWEKNKIEILVNKIGSDVLIHSDASLIDENDNLFSNSYVEYSHKLTKPHNLIEIINNGIVTGCTSMFKKELLSYILPFPNKLYVHDKWISVVAFVHGTVGFVKLPLIKYRQHSYNQIGATKVKSNGIIASIKNFIKKVDLLLVDNIFEKNQLCFIDIVVEKIKVSSKERKKLLILRRYYKYIIQDKYFKAFVLYVCLFHYFELNKPLKFRIGLMLRVLLYGVFKVAK